MKVAVTSQRPDLASEIDPRLGRAKSFIVVETDTGEFTAHDNVQNLNAVQGAGIQAAQNVVNLRAQAVSARNVGPKAFTTLQAGNVKAYVGAAGSVSETVEQLKGGRLKCVGKPNVGERWV